MAQVKVGDTVHVVTGGPSYEAEVVMIYPGGTIDATASGEAPVQGKRVPRADKVKNVAHVSAGAADYWYSQSKSETLAPSTNPKVIEIA